MVLIYNYVSTCIAVLFDYEKASTYHFISIIHELSRTTNSIQQ